MKFTAVLLLLGGSVLGSADTGSPVSRIVEMLTTMQETIEDDGKAEQQIYDKYACWCDTTANRKADNIATGMADLRALGQRILKLKGTVATLTAQITELNTKISDNQEDQEQLTSIRQKENKAFMSEAESTKQALNALQKAIKVLSDTSKSTSLLQAAEMTKSRSAVKEVLDAIPSDATIEEPQQLALLSEFTEARTGYAPQSGTIQGILGDMYSTFAADLEHGTSVEAGRNAKYENLLASLEEEKNGFEKTRDRNAKEKAEADAMLADTTKAYDDTDKQVQADTTFFDATKAACESKSKEWEIRKDMRDQELAGISKALEILTSDESRKLFASSIKPGLSFLQTVTTRSSQSESVVRSAYKVLRTQVRKTHNMRLAALAASVRVAEAGHFDEVLKDIDAMVQTLKDEQQADIDRKDQCLEEYQKNTRQVKKLNWQLKNSNSQISKFDKLIELRTGEKEDTIEKLQDTDKYMKETTAERKEEHEAFLKAQQDDKNAIIVLNKALDVMSAYYKKNDIKTGPIQGNARFIQEEKQPAAAPQAEFSDKGAHKGQAKGVLSMFAYIIEDLRAEIMEGKDAEEESQKEYEKEMASAKKLFDDLTEKKVTLESIIAKRVEQKEEEHKDKKDYTKDKQAELAYMEKIKPDCDWITKNFDQRAAARTAEQNGLSEAKELLAGQQSFIQEQRTQPRLSTFGFLRPH